MENKEAILSMLDDIDSGNNNDAQDKFNELIAARVSVALDTAKADYASKIYSNSQEQQTA